jgi:ubiquinol-cytochrome c reductase cytochrome b subunit
LDAVLLEKKEDYPVSPALSYFYNFGVKLLFALSCQIITGVFLAMYYIPEVHLAFDSIESLQRDVNHANLLRIIHANTASFFFIFVYLHILKGLYYGSYLYPRRLLWVSGMTLFLLMIITAFLGYVLPWGQMSFWAATVITNLASAIPFIGTNVVIWLWSSFGVGQPTLNKFFVLHFLFPFILSFVVYIHVELLHQTRSTNPLGFNWLYDRLGFMPMYVIKDILSTIVACLIFAYVIGFIPDAMGHPDNFIMANPESTPAHIVPEWYFLNFYAILRSIPSKSMGVLALAATIVVLIILPWMDKSESRNITIKIMAYFRFVVFTAISITLSYIGQAPLEEPLLTIGLILSGNFFIYFISLIFPIFTRNRKL